MGSQEKGRTGQGSRTKPLVLLEPVFVEMTAEEEQRALEVLAELLASLFLEPEREVSPASSHYQVSIRPDGTPGVVAIDSARGSRGAVTGRPSGSIRRDEPWREPEQA
jgi:hypothetical protein